MKTNLLSGDMFFFNKSVKAFSLLFFLLAGIMAFGQISIAAHNTDYNTNFNGWNNTLPTGFAKTGGTYVGTAASDTGGTYAISGKGFGWKGSGSATSVSLTGTFKNTTSTTITSLTLSYDAFTIVDNSRSPNWTVTGSANLGSVSGLTWTFNSSTDPQNKAITLTGLNIANNATFTLTFSSDRGGGSGSSPLIGLNNVKVKSIVAVASYSLTYNGNSNTSGTVPGQQTGSNSYTVYDNTGALARTGYTWAGWTLNAAGTGTVYGPSPYTTSSGTLTADTNLYARWAYTVSYDGNESTGGNVPSSQTNYNSNTTTLSGAGTLVRAGYTFGGWKTTSGDGGSATYPIGFTYTPSTGNATTTLYAHWTINNYAITYNANGATSGDAPASQSGNYNTTVNLRSNTESLARTGYLFAGWNTNASGTGTHYDENEVFTIPAGNTALFAEWKLIASYSGVSAGAGAEPATISSLINSQTDSVLNFDFTVTDDSHTTDGNDNLPTLISQIVIPQSTGNDIVNWTQAIDGAVLTDGTNTIAGTINAANITFSGIPATDGSLGYVGDGDSKTYSLKIWLKTTLGGTLSTTIDGQNLVFKIDRSNFTTAGSATSTQFEAGAGTVVESGANNNTVEVIATKIDFVQQPTNITVNTNISPAVTVSANDINGNRDRNYIAAVTMTSTGALTGTPVSSNAVSGLATFSTLRHTAAGTNLKLTADSSSFTSVESDIFNVTLVTQASDYFKSKEVTGTWATAGNWLSSPDNATWINSTLVPTSTASGITISDKSTITISASATSKNITIESGGVLTVNNSFTISGTNVVNGTWNQTSNLTMTNNGTLTFGANSIYNLNVNAGTIPTATWDETSNCNVIGFTGGGNVSGLTGIGQSFGNLTFNNTKTGYINLFAADGTMAVKGTLTVGPLTSNLVSFGNTANIAVTANVNKINVTGGALHGVGAGTYLSLNVATDLVVENSGAFRMSTGTGNAIVTIKDVLLKDNASLEVVAGTSTTVTSQILNVTRDFVINGVAATLNLRSNEGSGSGIGAGIVNVGRNFSSNNTSTDAVDVDFGAAGTVTNNAINIVGNLTHAGNGVYQTTASGQAKGFVFKGTASAPSEINYSGENSEYTSYEVDTNAYAILNTDLTLGVGTGPVSYFTVRGNLDFGDRSIIGNAVARFNTVVGSTLTTSNINGIGGTTAVGSLRSFTSVNSTAANGRAQFIAGANYTFNANTNAPFPTGTIGNPASLTFNNAEVVSNRTGSLAVSGAVNINGTSKFSLNSAGNSLALGGVMTIEKDATFDNNGENQITNGGGSIVINGKFITRDAQGFKGNNTSISESIAAPTLGDNSVIEYGLNGNQAVTDFAYKNLIFSGGGTKTTATISSITGLVTINDGVVVDAGTRTFGGAGTHLTILGSGKFITGGSSSKPDAQGVYSLSSSSTIEFTGASATQIRLAPHYANVIVSGSNVVAGTTTNGGLTFQENGSFTVKNGARFKVNNENGFSGAATTAIKDTNGPVIILEPGSTIDYTGNNQIISNNVAYENLTVSTAGTKTASPGNVVVNGLTTVSAGTLKVSETADHTTTNVLYAHKGIANSGGTVSFGSNAQLMQDVGAANTGDIVSARKSKLPKMGYTYWSSPVSSQNLYAFSNGGQEGGTPKNRFFLYDEATNLFKNTGAFLLDDSSVFVPGRGYAIRGMDTFGDTTPVSAHEFAFTGTPNNGGVSLSSLKWTNSNKGYNLVGNPYPSNIDFDLLYGANSTKIHPIAYFWTNNDMSITQQQANYGGNNYAIYNQMGGSPATYVEGDPNEPSSAILAPTNIIKVGQGFIIKTQDGMNNQSLEFTNDIRLTDNGVFFNNKFKADKDRFWLKMISPANIINTILLGYSAKATNGYELAYDTELLQIGSDSFYSLLNSKKLGIQGRASFIKEDKVTLGNVYMQNGNYRIMAAGKEGVFANGQPIYLKDKLLNKVIDITNADYTFQAVKGTDNTRFEVIYKPEGVLSADADVRSDLIIYKDQNMQVVKSSRKLGKIEMYDSSGKLVSALEVNGSEARIDTGALSNGVYILKIDNSGDLKTKKFIK